VGGTAVRWLIALGAAVTLVIAPTARACTPPDPPSTLDRPEKPDPPIKPLCASTNSCDEFEVKEYNDEVDEYNDKLEEYKADVDEYIAKLKEYVSETVEYAKCEVRELDN
jgi:hypothetical protein